MRLDKWLWAARFYKTRSLASDAVSGGKVKVNRQNAKPAREIKVGDLINLIAGEQKWEIEVKGLNEYRRPAPEARLLYEETPAGRQARERAAELQRLAPQFEGHEGGRPTKRDRRAIDRFQSE